MNLKSMFVGNDPDEPFWQGVRRRGRSIAIIFALTLVSIIFTYCVFLLSGSVWVTLGAATLCGIASSRAALSLDPVEGEAPTQSDKLLSLILFAPPLMLIAAVSIHTALHARDGFDVFKAGLAGGAFGSWLGFTVVILRGSWRVRT